MLVEHLYIVGVKTDDESDYGSDAEDCVQALFEKYSMTCGNVSKHVFTHPDDVVVKEVNDAKRKDLPVTDKEKARIPVNKAPVKNGLVGMYLVSEFYLKMQSLDGHTAKSVANLIKGLTPSLNYLNLIACGASKTFKTKSIERNFTAELCKELIPLNPVVSGYTDYIDVLFQGAKRWETADGFSRRKMEEAYKLAEGDVGRKWWRQGDGTVYGVKNNANHATLEASDRATTKQYWRCDNSGQAVPFVGPHTWSRKYTG